MRFLHARDQPVQSHDNGVARRQKTTDHWIYRARLRRIQTRKLDVLDFKIADHNVVIVDIHICLRLHFEDADDLFPAFRRQGKSHAKVELLEVCPGIDLWLIINEAALFVCAFPWPARISRRAGRVRLGLGGKIAGCQRADGQQKRDRSFHIGVRV